MRPLHLAFLSGACLVAGIAIGYALATLSSPSTAIEVRRPGGEEVGERDTGTHPDAHLAGRKAHAGARSTTDVSTITPSSDAVATADSPDPREEHAVLEVWVTDAERRPVRAQIHAVPQGVVGLDWDEGPYGDHDVPGPCRLRLPVAGTYDVYARSHRPYGAAHRSNVRVRQGETVSVRLAYEAGLPIRFVASEDWPILDELAAGRLKGGIALKAVDAATARPTSQSSVPAIRVGIDLFPPGGPWETAPLPPSLVFEAHVMLMLPDGAARDRYDGPAFGAFVEPTRLRPGETAKLRAERLASLHVRPRLASEDAWPEGPIGLELVLTDGRGSHPRTYGWGNPGALRRYEHPLLFSGRPGPARLAWDGPGVAPGALEDLHLDPRRRLEVEILVRIDSKEQPSNEPLVVEIHGIDTEVPDNEENYLTVEALLVSGDEDRPNRLDWMDDPASSIELDYGWRRATELVAWQGTRRVSQPTPIVPRGPVTVTLEPAGFLVVVPDRLLLEGEGLLRIRSSDGQPFLLFGDHDQPRIVSSAVVQPGDVVGPLPAGRHVFRVELSGRRLPDASATVRARGVGVLRLAW